MVKHLKLFEIQQIGQTIVVCPQGQGSSFRYRDLHVEANAIRHHLLKYPNCSLVVDLSRMDYCGSEFIGSLVSMLREVRSRGNAALFCAANPHIYKVLDNMSLYRLWPYYPTREEALQAAQGSTA